MCDLLTATDGKVQIVNVKMDDIEFRGPLEYMFKHDKVVRQLIYAVLVEAQRTPACRNEPGLGYGIAACE